jgi:hypothetical protein
MPFFNATKCDSLLMLINLRICLKIKFVILSIAKDLLQEPITCAKYAVEDPSLCSG